MATSPKRHHYVPRFLLEMFGDERGHLHLFDRERGQFYKGSPNNIFFETYLYRFLDPFTGKSSDVVESELGRMETNAAPVVQKIIRSVRSLRNPRLSSADRLSWAKFYYAQSRRTLENLASCLEDDERLDAQARAIGITLHDVDDAIKKKGMPFFASGVAAGLREEEYCENVGLMSAVAVRPAHGFVIGSCGVPLGAKERDIFFRGWLPLAPNVAVRATVWPHREILVPIPSDAREVIQKINLIAARQSRIIAAKSWTDLHTVVRRLDS